MRNLWEIILRLGDGSWAIGLFTLPFAINGFILFVKGVFALLEKIDGKYDFKSGLSVGLLGIVLLLSYMALFIAVKRLSKFFP